MSGLKPDPEQQLSDGLRRMAADMRELEASAKVEAAVVSAFRRKRERRMWPVWTGAAAAGVALAIGLLTRPRVENAPRPAPPPAARTEQPGKTAPLPKPAPSLKRRILRAAAPESAPNPPQAEVATDFFPMRNGPLLDPQEQANVVRMRVPRATVSRFGLPVDWFGEETTVRADLVLGQDGTARAIRFVK